MGDEGDSINRDPDALLGPVLFYNEVVIDHFMRPRNVELAVAERLRARRSITPGRKRPACCIWRSSTLCSTEANMPLYEFFCPACRTQRELLLSLAEASSARCPACGGGLERCLTAPADYRNAHPRPAGRTCCGREERCDTPPCGPGGQQGCCHDGK